MSVASRGLTRILLCPLNGDTHSRHLGLRWSGGLPPTWKFLVRCVRFITYILVGWSSFGSSELPYSMGQKAAAAAVCSGLPMGSLVSVPVTVVWPHSLEWVEVLLQAVWNIGRSVDPRYVTAGRKQRLRSRASVSKPAFLLCPVTVSSITLESRALRPRPTFMTDASAGISDEERRKRSVYYQACTSPVKDDIPTLVKCLRTDQGPHNRQEAGFLLWHHALDRDSVSELVSGGVISACVSLLDAPTVPCTDKAVLCGILLALVAADVVNGGAGDVAEAVVRCRAQTGAACLDVLHGLLLARDNDLARSCSAKLLAALAKAAGPAVMKSLVVEGALPYLPTYQAVWAGEQRDAPLIAATCRLVEQLVCQSPELAAVVVAAGGVPSLDVLRKHKAEVALEAALGLLVRLLALEEARSELVAQGGVPLLADVMGPPPRAVLRWQKEQEEQQQQQQQEQQQQSPAKQGAEATGKQGKEQGVEQQQKAQDAQRAKVKGQQARGQQGDTGQQPAAAAAAGRGGGVNRGTSVSGGVLGAPVVVVDGGSPESRRTAANSPSLPLREPSLSIFSKVQGTSCGANSLPGSPKAGASCASLSTERSLSRVAPDGASSSPSPPQPGPDIATNRSGVRWIMLPGLELAGAAAACLATLTQSPECMEEMDRRCTLQRILPHLAAATTPKTGEGTKKSKKGGLALSAAATAALRPLMALLKFLALTNANRYRVARYGALPAVVSLYGGTADFLLRTHCQAILSSVALIAENGQSLQEAKMPEEFLVPNPMRLAPDERQVLRIEFPGEGALD